LYKFTEKDRIHTYVCLGSPSVSVNGNRYEQDIPHNSWFGFEIIWEKVKVSKFREHGSRISLFGDTIQQACQHYFIKTFYWHKMNKCDVSILQSNFFLRLSSHKHMLYLFF
jgi:hypothetical protein